MKAAIIGRSPRVLDAATAAVCYRWPDAALFYAVNVQKSLELIEKEWPNLLVLHTDVQDSNPSQLIQSIRTFSNVPLLVLGKGEEMEAITSLESGADDYVRLPCDLSELTVRLWALIRRADSTDSFESELPLTSGELMVDPSSNKAFLEGETLNLTSTEFKMLFLLVKNSGIVVSRQTIEGNIWSERGESHGLVKKYVQRLRLKLRDDARQPSWIMNVHGAGPFNFLPV